MNSSAVHSFRPCLEFSFFHKTSHMESDLFNCLCTNLLALVCFCTIVCCLFYFICQFRTATSSHLTDIGHIKKINTINRQANKNWIKALNENEN